MFNFNKIITNTNMNIDFNTIEKHVIKYCQKNRITGMNQLCSIKNSGLVKDKFKARDFIATSLSAYDCFNSLNY